MTGLLKKLNILLITSAVSAGIVFFCGFTVRLPKGVEINGINVGGLTRAEAVSEVRKSIEEDLKGRTLTISGADSKYTFSYPEIYYKDDLQTLLNGVKKNGIYTASVSYYLCGSDEIASAICRNERIFKVEPHASFRMSGQPFDYFAGNDGREVDKSRLKSDISKSLAGGFEEVKIKYISVPRSLGMESVKADTALLGRFTTYFDSSNVNRSGNIRLAAALINGTTVGSGEVFSFNSAVGARLPERGFLPAKIIENGEYTEGVGGGVCQVSTTLYNAALLSGMKVEEFHAHSLAVGYVDPSRDAMVSGSLCDLKFTNPSAMPAYIRAETGEGYVSFSIYGRGDGAKYSLESAVTEVIPPPEEISSDPSAAREGKDGVKSELYLIISRGGYVKRVCLRRDVYLPVKRVVLPAQDPPEESGGENLSAFRTQNLVKFKKWTLNVLCFRRKYVII